MKILQTLFLTLFIVAPACAQFKNTERATATRYGVVKPDNVTITVDNGVLTAVGVGGGPTNGTTATQVTNIVNALGGTNFVKHFSGGSTNQSITNGVLYGTLDAHNAAAIANVTSLSASSITTPGSLRITGSDGGDIIFGSDDFILGMENGDGKYYFTSGNGGQFVFSAGSLSGANLTDGTINSNKLDAATRAMFGTGGVGGGADKVATNAGTSFGQTLINPVLSGTVSSASQVTVSAPLEFTGPLVLNLLQTSSLLKTDPDGFLTNIVNASGALVNDGLGGFSFVPVSDASGAQANQFAKFDGSSNLIGTLDGRGWTNIVAHPSASSDTNLVGEKSDNTMVPVSLAGIASGVTALVGTLVTNLSTTNIIVNPTGGDGSNYFGGINFIGSNAAPYRTVSPSGLNSIAFNQGWTNNFNQRADMLLQICRTNHGDPGSTITFTNTVTGEAWTNYNSGEISNTNVFLMPVLDISPGDYGSFSNYNVAGSGCTIIKAWWKLK
jgi:hypothetical protein